MVEVGGALGPSFEAQAIDVSEEGMHLRTAYLPEVGQPLSCSFDAGAGGSVLATGEVVWKQDATKGGEFGIRFTNLDAQSSDALKRIIGLACQPPASIAKGNRVRLHIEGLGSPMRAHVREAKPGVLTAFSGLGFLQVGKHLELEDASTGAKRPAKVVRVECEVDAESRVPQLVMSFQYEDEAAAEEAVAKENTPEPVVTQDPKPEASVANEDEAIERASSEMKGFLGRTASKVTPTLERLFNRAKTTAALLAAKRRGGTGDDVAVPTRRRTSPPPQGGLHATGRKVVRESLASAKEIPDSAPKKWNAKKLGVGAGVVVATIVGAIALHKPSAPAAPPEAPDTTAQAGGQVPTTAPAPLTPPPSVLAPVSPASPSSPPQGTPTSTTSGATEVATNDVLDDATEGSRGHHRAAHVAPFGNVAVSHGNVLRLKMDGDIEKIEGDGLPTGFSVVLPGRRSLEPAAPLAARDSRIASIRVTNDGSGAELTVAFRDGVPNYLVRAKGDVLEIVLAPTGALADAQKPVRSANGAPPPHRHHHHKHTDSK